jgi:hypothetical protein
MLQKSSFLFYYYELLITLDDSQCGQGSRPWSNRVEVGTHDELLERKDGLTSKVEKFRQIKFKHSK